VVGIAIRRLDRAERQIVYLDPGTLTVLVTVSRRTCVSRRYATRVLSVIISNELEVYSN
jgi:hypothetical protein